MTQSEYFNQNNIQRVGFESDAVKTNRYNLAKKAYDNIQKNQMYIPSRLREGYASPIKNMYNSALYSWNDMNNRKEEEQKNYLEEQKKNQKTPEQLQFEGKQTALRNYIAQLESQLASLPYNSLEWQKLNGQIQSMKLQLQ